MATTSRARKKVSTGQLEQVRAPRRRPDEDEPPLVEQPCGQSFTTTGVARVPVEVECSPGRQAIDRAMRNAYEKAFELARITCRTNSSCTRVVFEKVVNITNDCEGKLLKLTYTVQWSCRKRPRTF